MSVAMIDEGSGPVAMLLHAFPCDHHMWDEQIPAIVDIGWRVLVPDLPGFGASPLPAEGELFSTARKKEERNCQNAHRLTGSRFA